MKTQAVALEPHAVNAQSYALQELTFPQVLARWAQRSPHKVFLTETASGRSFTYGELNAWTDRVAHALAGFGVSRGSHVGLLMGNSAEHLAAFLAISKIGAVSVPVNTAARGELLRYYLAQSDCETVIVDAALAARLQEVLGELPLLRRVLVLRTGEEGESGIEPGAGMAVADFHALVDAAPAAAFVPPVQPRFCDLVLIAYTSGTTGPSKGSMLSQAAALTYGTSAAEAQGYRASDIFYVCLPLFHNNALLAATGAALVCGASVVMSRRFSVSRFWGEIRESQATITNFLGAMSSFLWSQPPSPADTDHCLRLVSMAPTPKYAAEFEQRFGLRAMNNYGLSDYGMVTSFTQWDPRDKLGSIGRPRRGVQIAIVDDDDLELAPGEVGEMVLRFDDPWRGTMGYYKMPEATLNSRRNLWFHTGDRGMQDADGYLYFVDRKKDCIRRRGENISAFEVEQIICTHPDVADAAVFPVATPANDEEVAAVIVAKPGASLDELQLVEHCQRNMAYFMVPRYVQFRASLPTTMSQKVEKFKLRQELEAGLSQAWDREAAGVVLAR
ncbi:AMP-binding protein [Xenophilus arseniciresistens]|uniref:AMP-binding protein n=1 Tax=Xenophilus arseniciresistens TaxID=1283306 RepID=A0AAE3T199_9BURK|nr:AMP-binding protein [Xenophilus arseniciresistens]MDA7418999.1 AMP-binding protein [Xenophilus arseniciresistens]